MTVPSVVTPRVLFLVGAAAMIDRLAHHGQLIAFEGESYRLKHALMRQK